MTTGTTDVAGAGLMINEKLLQSVIRGGLDGVEMTGKTAVPVGASELMSAKRTLTVIVGLIGRHTGTMTFNLSEFAALALASGMLGEDQTELNEDVLDAIGEIGNIIAGSIKDQLLETDLEFTNISCPSIIVGSQYELYYYRGFTTCSVEFELPGIPISKMAERFFTIAVSLMKR